MNKIIKYIQNILNSFAMITTAVVIVTASYIEIFWGSDTILGVEILWQILIVSGLCALGCVLMPYSEDMKVSKVSLLIRKILYFLYVNVVVLGGGVLFDWFYLSDWKMLLGMEIAIILVFVTIFAISYFVEYREAEKMNQKLQERS